MDVEDGDNGPRYRNICFTVQALEGEPLRLLDFSHPTWQHVKYCIYQREMGTHEHFQGYLELTNQKTFKALHRLDGLKTAHFEKRMGSAKQAAHYCSKPHDGCTCNQCHEERREPTYLEGPWSFGEMSQQGQRTELMLIQVDLNKGKRLRDIAMDNFPEWVRFGRAFKEYRRMIAVPRHFKPIVILIIGPSGLGKSRFAHDLARYLQGDEFYYIVPEKTTGVLWCDDYDGQDVFFCDEFDGSRCRPTFFNGLVDRYPFVVPSHGGAGSHLTSHYMVFVSNYHPKYWWKNRSLLQLEQTMRRIDVLIPFFKPTRMHEHLAWQDFENNINRPEPALNDLTTWEGIEDYKAAAGLYPDPEPESEDWSDCDINE